MTAYNQMRCEPTVSAAVAALVLFWGCANQGPPPGGPPDLIPPWVVATTPVDGAVNVDSLVPIEVVFSESMNRRSVERSVFVSPRLSEQPRLKWKGRRLTVVLSESFHEERTYRVSVGAESADEARNRMRSSYDFAFSTGPRISKGELSGTVGGEGRTILLLAYEIVPGEDPDPARDVAGWTTQAGSAGEFRFPSLRLGTYCVFAFTDQDRDQMFTPDVDALAVPPALAIIEHDSARVRLGRMRVVRRDTFPPRIVSARTKDHRHVQVRFDEPLSEVGEISAQGLDVVAVHRDVEDTSRVWLATTLQTEETSYVIHVSGAVDLAGNIVQDTTVTVVGDGREDRRPPQVVRTVPETGAAVGGAIDIALIYDEAVVLPADAVWLPTDSTDAPPGSVWQPAPNVISFRPDRPWERGSHALTGAASVTDLAGNQVKDPVAVRFEVRVDPPGAIVGRVIPNSDPVVVEAARLGSAPRESRFVTRVTPGDSTFTIADIPPGRYTVGAFGDTDADGIWDAGSANPFSPAEPLSERVDTVDVAARWEVVIDKAVVVFSIDTEDVP